MHLSSQPRDLPQAIAKTPEWLTRAEVIEHMFPDAGQQAVWELWDRLVGETWLGQGANVAGHKVSMALCAEGFRDEWCVAVGDLRLVQAEATRIQDEVERSSRMALGPLATIPKTSKWLTQRQVANALSLDSSDRHLDAFFRDLTAATWEDRKPRLTKTKLRISLCSVGRGQVWCLHAEDLRAFAVALMAAAKEMERVRPAPQGWLTLHRLAARTGLSAGVLAPRWRQSRPGTYETASEPQGMLSSAEAYKVASDTARDRGTSRWEVPVKFLAEKFPDDEDREQANDFLRELSNGRAVAVLGPLGLCYEIGRIEMKGRREVPYIHPDCLERFKSEMRARTSPDNECEPVSGPAPG